jgi:hypothetical protein
VVTLRELREEARLCRELIHEIDDPLSVEMLRDRAEQLERQAAQMDKQGRARLVAATDITAAPRVTPPVGAGRSAIRRLPSPR